MRELFLAKSKDIEILMDEIEELLDSRTDEQRKEDNPRLPNWCGGGIPLT